MIVPPAQEANKKHSVNGYIFCNMPEISVPEGSKLRLVLIGVGGQSDMHTPGFTNLIQNTPTGSSYVVELFPGSARIAGMYAGKCNMPLPQNVPSSAMRV